nr:MAG TPA: hypothetical protein [Bacteriophage sp.]DAZ22417.1 MAG TPA: hypothetical protein [Caudoviricetes sp.]
MLKIERKFIYSNHKYSNKMAFIFRFCLNYFR